MGNSLINDQKSTNPNLDKNKLIVNYKIKPDRNKKIIENKNKRSKLDLFENKENDINNKNISKKGKEIKIQTDIKLKNNSINEENNNNILRNINNNPINKIKNQMKHKNEKTTKENLKLDNKNFINHSINGEFKNDNKNHKSYVFEKDNHKFFQHNNKKDINYLYKIEEENYTSERTINNTNSDGEFFFDNMNVNDEIKEKTNAKCQIIKNIKNKNNVGSEELIRGKNSKLKKVEKNNKIKINDIKYLKIKPKSKQDNHRKYNSIINIHHTNDNNVLLISSFLIKSKTYPRNKINKSDYHQIDEDNVNNNNINYNFSLENLSNNIKCLKNPNTISYKEKNEAQLKKIRNKININTKKLSSSNYSYNYNNFYISNNEYRNNRKNNNIDEKRKMAELIRKIPNNELKNEIMNLYQKIINYNDEFFINEKNRRYNYIITFSNKYIIINDKEFVGKKFDGNNFKKKNIIKIALLPYKQKNYRNNSLKIKENSKEKNNLKTETNFKGNKIKINNYNKIKQTTKKTFKINNLNNNESIFKQYTYKQYKKYQCENIKLRSAKKQFDFSKSNFEPKIRAKNPKNYSLKKNKKEKNKIKINNINPKIWKKIINLNEVTINKENIFLKTIIEKNTDYKLIKEVITNYSEKGNDRNIDEEKKVRNHSMNIKQKKEKDNYFIETSKSIDIVNIKDKANDLNKYDGFSTYNLDKEKIFFRQNLKKLIRVKNLLKDLKSYHNNFIFKEEDLVMINSLCLVTKDYIIIFKDKEKKNPMFKKKLNYIKKVMSFKKNCKYIIIIEFYKSKNTEEIENYEKDKYLGLLIDNEKNYNEFIGLFSQLIPNLEIEFLN